MCVGRASKARTCVLQLRSRSETEVRLAGRVLVDVRDMVNRKSAGAVAKTAQLYFGRRKKKKDCHICT